MRFARGEGDNDILEITRYNHISHVWQWHVIHHRKSPMAGSAQATRSVLPACAVETTAVALKAGALGALTAVIAACAAHAPGVTLSAMANALVCVAHVCACACVCVAWARAIRFGRGVTLSQLTLRMSGSDQ